MSADIGTTSSRNPTIADDRLDDNLDIYRVKNGLKGLVAAAFVRHHWVLCGWKSHNKAIKELGMNWWKSWGNSMMGLAEVHNTMTNNTKMFEKTVKRSKTCW